jgi:hypothetical protein
LRGKAQAPHHPTHRRETDAHAGDVGQPCTELFQGHIGLIVHYPADKRLGSRIHTWLLAAGMGLWAQLAGGAIAAAVPF